MMADNFNFLWSKIQNYIAEADANLIPVQRHLELHGICRCGVLLSPCFGALFVADLILGMEELELHTIVTEINTGRQEYFEELILHFHHRKITAKILAGINSAILALGSVFCSDLFWMKQGKKLQQELVWELIR